MTAVTAAAQRPQETPACRVLRYGRHEDTVACAGCGEPFLRARGATYTACLRCEMARALADAGIAPDDPALAQWAAWNDAVTRRAAG